MTTKASCDGDMDKVKPTSKLSGMKPRGSSKMATKKKITALFMKAKSLK